MTVIAETFEFDYRGETFLLDLNVFPASEAIWLERVTKYPLSYLMTNFAAGGMTGAVAFLMLALRRAGRHSLANWDKLQSMSVVDSNEFIMRRVPLAADDEDEGDGGGEDAGPTSPSRSTSTGSATATPTAAT